MSDQDLRYLYEINYRVALRNCEGISEEQALRVVNDSSCVNWLIGHMLQSRNNVLVEMGAARLQSPEQMEWYRPSHEAEHRSGTPATLQEVLSWWTNSQEAFLSAMDKALDCEDPAKAAERRKSFVFRAFHESYHVGQIAILRRVNGLEGMIK